MRKINQLLSPEGHLDWAAVAIALKGRGFKIGILDLDEKMESKLQMNLGLLLQDVT